MTEALNASGTTAYLVTEDGAGESAACFEKPVVWDVVGEDGRKLAGAGQKRTRSGLLHQGSVLGGKGAMQVWVRFFTLTGIPWTPEADVVGKISKSLEDKYRGGEWLGRR